MHVKLSSVLLTLAAVLTGAVITGVFVLYAGFYNVAATHQHLAPTYWLLGIGLRESIERHARDTEVPPPADAALIERGRKLYRAHCVQCHGAPGVAPEPFALGMAPLPANLAYVARERTPAEILWVVRNGIKMTGMPAWQYRFTETDLWAVTAFVQQLALISPADYALQARAAPNDAPLTSNPGGSASRTADPQRGKLVLKQYACTTCHRIPDVLGDQAPVGPPLDRIGTRQYIAGVLPNTPSNMVRWLRTPQQVDPLTAMPNLGVTERDAWDMAAYLYTLR